MHGSCLFFGDIRDAELLLGFVVVSYTSGVGSVLRYMRVG